jgi:Nif-specific regulatory protein
LEGKVLLVNGRYELTRLLGEGGMGAVHLAHDTHQNNRKLALKLLRADALDPEAIRRFRDEFRSMTLLRHPNLAEVYDFGTIDGPAGGPFLTMEFIAGGDLDRLDRRVALDRVDDLAAQCLRALDYIHARGLLHNDIKPQNLLVHEPFQIKLVDFGLAQPLAAEGSGALSGTIHYIAPERIGGVTPAANSDLYSLGVVLFELLAGELPFRGDDPGQVIEAILHGTPPSVRDLDPDVPERIAAFLTTLMARDPKARPASAAAAMALLNDGAATPLTLDTAETCASFVTSGRMVGRDAELGELIEAIDAHVAAPGVDNGTPRMIFVSGASGLGKSRLLRELRHHLQLGGIPNVTGRCYETGGAPLQPVVEALRSLPEGPDDGAPAAGILAALRMPLGPSGTGADDRARTGRLDRAEFITHLATALDQRAAGGAGVLFVEDLHWCDGPTIDLMHHLLFRAVRSRWLIVGTLRDEGAAPINPFLERFARLSRLRRLELRPLGRDAIADLLASMLPFEEEPRRLADLLAEQTSGNPLYIEELMKDLAGEGTLRRRGASWTARLESIDPRRLGTGLTAIVARRLAELSRAERDIIALLAVFNRPVRSATLARALGLAGEALPPSLESLENLRLITLDRTRPQTTVIDLSHSRIREAAYGALAAAQRRTLHGAAAAAIEAAHPGNLDEVVEDLAHHYTQAGELERAVDYSLRAARKAQSLFNPGQRAMFLLQAHRQMPDDDHERRLRTLDEASNLKGTALGDHAATLELGLTMEHEASRAGSQYHLVKALCYQVWAQSFLGKEKEAQAAGRRALATARAAGDRNALAAALNYCGLLHARGGRQREALPHLEESSSYYRELGRPADLLTVLNNAGLCHLGLGEPEKAEPYLREALDLQRDAGLHYDYHHYLTNLAPVRLDQGDVDGAIGTLEQAIDWPRRNVAPAILANYLGWLGQAYAMQGRYDRAIAALEESRQIYTDLGQETEIPPLLDYLGNCQREIGRLQRASALHREGLDLARRLDSEVQEAHLLVCLAADSLAAGESEEALSLARQARERSRALHHTRIAFAAECVEAIAGGCDDRRALAAMARRIARHDLRALRFPDRLRRHLVLGHLARAAGKPEEALREARAGIEAAKAGGFHEFHWKLLALLGAALEASGRLEEAAAAYNEGHRLTLTIASQFEDSSMRDDYEGEAARRRLARKAAGASGAPGASADGTPMADNSPAAPDIAAAAGASIAAGDDRSARMLAKLYEITRAINSILEPEPLLDKVMDLAIESVGAERGLIFLLRDGGAEMDVVVARNLDQETIKDATEYSRSILREAGRGRPVLTHDAAADDRFRNSKSVALYHIRSLMCVPLRLKDRIIGTVYVDTRKLGALFGDDQLRFLEAFADQAVVAIDNARLFAAVRQENTYLKKAVRERYGFENIVGRSAPMRGVFNLISKVAGSNLSVLIRGESGTGKELVARAIHHNSHRKDARFFSENCAALPDTLLASELFGHVKGAFTGADTHHKGVFEMADRGTLFLDEVGDMSMTMQSKLLRVLQDGEIRPVGSESARKVDVRIVSATNRDLEEMIEAKEFRRDLFFRINGVVVPLPALRERRDDIPLLVEHFLARVARENNTGKLKVDPALMAALTRHDWPGNVRELENQVYRLALFTSGDTVTLDDARNDPEFAKRITPLASPGTDSGVSRAALERALDSAGGDRTEAARILGISRATLFRKLRQHNVGSKRRKAAGRESQN